MDKLYTCKEVTQMLKISKATFYNWVKDGKLHIIKIGSNVRVTSEEIERLLKGGF